MARLLTAAVIAVAVTLPAVATGPISAVSTPPRSARSAVVAGVDGWDPFPRWLPKPVAVRRTGGFTGALQIVRIRTSGHWRYTDSRQPEAAAQGQLNRWQMRQLSTLLSDPGLEADLWRHPRPIGCADAFHYSVAVGWSFFAAGYFDCRDPGGPMAALVQAVIAFTPL